MKKWIKIILIIVGVIALCFVIDFICIFTINRPLFAIKAKQPYTYTGLFYDTYNCPEYSIPQIKAKTTKFTCAIERGDIGKVIEIVDTTKDIKNFTCAEALEQFYEDEYYTYYYSCIKSKYVIVKYESGYEETVDLALKNGTIKIEDLDTYKIDYIKNQKGITSFIETIEEKNCDKTAKFYYGDSSSIYTYCLESVKINRQELKEYLSISDVTAYSAMEGIVDRLEKEGTFWDGGSTLYKDGGSIKYTNNGISILMCNTIAGNKDIYIGTSDMSYEDGFCK